MKILLFNWEDVDIDINDPSELTNEEFERLSKLGSGAVLTSLEDFQSKFNAEHFSTHTHQLRIIADEDEKDERVNYIKKVVKEWGSVTIAELELDSSPCLSSDGNFPNTCSLVEGFNEETVTVVQYVHETEVASNEVEYESLSVDIIDEIISIIENYEAINLQTEKRCSD